jgi:hypothetical protein
MAVVQARPTDADWQALWDFDWDLHFLCLEFSRIAKGDWSHFVGAKNGESVTAPKLAKPRRGERMNRLIEIRGRMRELIDKYRALAHRLHPLIRPIAPASTYGGVPAPTMHVAIWGFAGFVVGLNIDLAGERFHSRKRRIRP